MRTPEEIQQHIDPKGTFHDWEYDQDAAYDDGMNHGMEHLLKMVQEGKTVSEIKDYAEADQSHYVSVGDDKADAWQSGWLTAHWWGAEQFDWDEDGMPHFRPGNVFNEPVN